jgi:hypothetical protein
MQRKNHLHAAFIALLALLVLSPLSLAGPSAVPTLAGILAELNHYPSAAHKETLAAISQDEANSDATRTIATAIHNIEHKAKPDDVAKLTKIQGDDKATAAEKQLAAIIMELSHSANAEAKKALKALSQ